MKKLILIILFIFILNIVAVPVSLARPITEVNNKNIEALDYYYQKHYSKHSNLFNLYQDIPFDHPDFINIHLVKKIGLFGEDQSEFDPKKTIDYKEFLTWYLFLFEQNKLGIDINEFYNFNSEEEKAFIKKIRYKISHKKRVFLDDLEQEFITEKKANELLNIKKGNEHKLNRLEAFQLLFKKFSKTQYYRTIKSKYLDYKYPRFSRSKPKITHDNKFLLVNEIPLKGIFVNWMEYLPKLKDIELKEEIKKMKDLGIIGVSLEIGWDEIEKTEGEFKFPRYFDNVLNLLKKEGLYVHLLLSAHYTPDWVFEKYDKNIQMVDKFGTPQEEGEYATFSYLSPAVSDQIEFQKKTIDYYEKFPNIVTFLLGNEQSYGRLHYLDYSVWFQKGFKEWMDKKGIKVSNIPTEKEDINFIHWKRFRQITLNNYLNKVYKESKKVQDRIPLSFKFIPYENVSAYAPMYGLHLSPLELEMDFLATDIYGYTSNVFALQNSFKDLPKVVIETNLPGEWSRDSMFKFLLTNYLNGIYLQSIFAWIKADFENTLYNSKGEIRYKTLAIKEVSQIINLLDYPDDYEYKTAIIIPTNGLNMEGENFQKYQHKVDDLIDKIFKETSLFPVLLWSDDVYNKEDKHWDKEELEKYDEIIIIDSDYDKTEELNLKPSTKIYSVDEKDTTPEKHLLDKLQS